MKSRPARSLRNDPAGAPPVIVFGLPSGSLQAATLALLRKAGFGIEPGERSYLPDSDDPEISPRLIRAQEIGRYVENGHLDAGITGWDWIREYRSRIVEVAELPYAKRGFRPVRWVLAVPGDSPARSVRDLAGKRIATEAVGLTRRYLRRHRVRATVEFSWGATEVKVPDLADAIVDVTETGASLRAHNLRILDTILESTPRLIANPAAWRIPRKRRKMEQVALLLNGVLAAEGRVLLKLNVEERRLRRVLRLLPSLHAPTVNRLSSEGWHSVESVVGEPLVRRLIPELKRAGAEGIIEIPIRKIIP